MGQYNHLNAQAVLDQVNTYILALQAASESHTLATSLGMKWKGYSGWKAVYNIDAVYEDLAIFDWWKDELSLSQLKQMQKFLTTAIEMGFTGKVSFKVGAAGCSHGMWAHKAESTNGYDPDGDALYHSFRSGDNYWDVRIQDKWLGTNDLYKLTLRQVQDALAAVGR